tara:strand:+ start:2043 stop:3122 length:1080 start_codon:yes stop_codon:yes gene_type:complete
MKQKTSKKTRLLANDNGYADHKLAWLADDGAIMTLKVPTLIQVGSSGLATTAGQRKGAYCVDNVEYSCNASISEPMKVRNSDYPTSIANRVLFTHAMVRAGLLGMPVKASVTLPFRDYYSHDGSMNEELKAACKANFMQNNVEIVGITSKPEIVDVEVRAEALSAFMDWAMTDKFQWSDKYNELEDMLGEVLVVDIGGSTTDLVTLQIVEDEDGPEMAINHNKSGTEKVGVLDAKARLSELAMHKMQMAGVSGLSGHGAGLTAMWLEQAMQRKQVMYAGKKWDVSEEIELSCRGVAERISNYIKTTVGSPESYYAILVVGGGAIVFRKWLEQMLPNAVFTDEFANARGLLKFMIYKESE